MGRSGIQGLRLWHGVSVVVTLVAAATLITGCSSAATVGTASTDSTPVAIDMPEFAQVWVEGQPIPGLDETNLWCTRSSRSSTFALTGTATSDGETVFSADLTNTQHPRLVKTVFEIDGVRYVTDPTRSRGSAEVEINGDKITVTGVAVDAETRTTSKAYQAEFSCYQE
ncbi:MULTISPECIES: lipoprotein LpqH [unclassified Gordonia (in: high G+C Gram-positive bacteria)]|uniref:lipoprotein LpqH n=1 Tax=unclassified Gordonia (in: high G+C Gram-positive bacteria) TaxID=2657482 RepID=UPI001F101799|nr:lipoprotein LpqH [Gordonia sp. ABSL49_1]MCH5641821.1 lipoprotein LpqH [Gordonia sp. ABSL49_1]